MSPTRSVPFCTITLATMPRSDSCWASRQVPTAGRFGLALYSCSSATVSSVSSSSSMPVPVVALVFTTSTSPPHSLGSSSLVAKLLYRRGRG